MDKESQIIRLPKKYWDLINSLSNEDSWKLLKCMFSLDWCELEWLLKTYFEIIKVDLVNLEKWAVNWLKWWRPKKDKTPGYENEKPPVMKNDNLNEDKTSINIKKDKENYNEQLEKIIEYRNNIFKEKRQVTVDLLKAYKNLRKKYTKEDFSKWFKEYCKKKVNEDKQYLLSPISFLTQKNWFISYL